MNYLYWLEENYDDLWRYWCEDSNYNTLECDFDEFCEDKFKGEDMNKMVEKEEIIEGIEFLQKKLFALEQEDLNELIEQHQDIKQEILVLDKFLKTIEKEIDVKESYIKRYKEILNE